MASNEEISNENVSNLTDEQRLKALLFQYSKLYARWAEDREVFNKGMAGHEEALEEFTQKINQFEQQIGNFKNLEPRVRENLAQTIKSAASSIASSVNEKIDDSMTSTIDSARKKLEGELNGICRALAMYKEEMQDTDIKTHIKIILATMGVAIASSLLTVHFLIPKPITPLSHEDMETYIQGSNIQAIWQKLPRRTQIEIDESARKNFGVGHPFGDLTSRDGENNEDGQSDENTGR
jgi:hypothetical protein